MRVRRLDKENFLSPGQRKLSVITRCPYQVGVRKAGFGLYLYERVVILLVEEKKEQGNL